MDIEDMKQRIAMGLATGDAGVLAELATSILDELALVQNALTQARETNGAVTAEISGLRRDARGFPG